MERYDVIQGAESFYYKGNDIGILVSHGFMDSSKYGIYRKRIS